MNSSDLPDFVARPQGIEAHSLPLLAWSMSGTRLPTGPSRSGLSISSVLQSDGAKVAMKLFGRPDVDLLSFARIHFLAMADNGYFLEPMPSQETFATVLGDFEGSLMAVEALRTALKEALAHKDALRALLEQTLDQRSCYVQAASNGNRAVMMTSALGVQRKRHKVGPLDPPLGLRVIPGPSEGEVILTWGKVKHATVYLLKYGPEGEVPEVMGLNGRRKRILKLPVLDVPYVFSIAASGSSGVSSYSPPVRLMVR
jgi:hypothetical protein